MAKMNPYGGGDWGGLFASQGNTLDDVRAKIGQEREGKVRQAYADAISGGGSLNAARVARAAEQQKQLMMGTVQNLFGSKDGIIKQDPRLAKAAQMDTDRREMMDLFKTSNMDKPEDFYRMASELYKRGYPGDAAKLVEQGHGFRAQTQAETSLAISKHGADTSRLSVENTHKIAKNNIQLKSQRLDLDTWAAENNIDLNKAKFMFDKIVKKHNMQNADKLTNLQATKIRNDLFLGKARLSVTEKLGLGNLAVSKQNADINEHNSRVNQVYGLEEQSRKRMSAGAAIRQADANLALRKNLGLRAAAVADRGADQGDRSLALQADRDAFGKFLSMEKHEYNKLSTDRLYEMSMSKQMFDQHLSARGMSVQEELAEHRIMQDGKEYDYKVYDSTRNHHLAQADFELRDRLGTAGMTLKQQDSIHRQWADEVNIKLKGDKQNFDQETTRQNQELLRDQFQWRKEFDTAGLNQRKIENLADQQLRGMSLELQEKGIDINRLNAQERIALATKEFAFKKFLGIAGLDDADADRKLTRELAGNADKFKQQGIDLQRASLGQKKELFNLELKQRAVLARMKDATIKSEGSAGREAALRVANIKTNTPKTRTQKTFGPKETAVLEDILSKNENWDLIKDKFEGREEWTRGLSSVDSDTRREVADELSGIMATNDKMTIYQAFEIYAGKKAGGGNSNKNDNDVSRLLNPPPKGTGP